MLQEPPRPRQDWRTTAGHSPALHVSLRRFRASRTLHTHATPKSPAAMLTDIALVILLSVFNGFFALSEMALVASRKSRLKQMAQGSATPRRRNIFSPPSR